MKINWGTGITIALLSFASYILYMVIYMATTHTDIVEKDYYQKQVNYQSEKEALENGLSLENELTYQIENNFLTINFPDKAKLVESKEGSVHFYRPDNAKLDRKIALDLTTNQQNISLEDVSKGGYTLNIRWSNDQNYVIKKEISIP